MPKIETPLLFLFAGEPSGDLHGQHLMQALKQQAPKAQFLGVGGPEMRNQGLKPLLKMEDFAVMGFTDVLLALPKLYKQFYIVRNQILKQSPAAVILIDYPDFNLRLAKSLRRKGYAGKIVHYISPTVWAWRRSRIYTMADTLDLLMTIYPFERAHYLTTTLKVRFVGNPLTEYLNKYAYTDSWKEKLNIPNDIPIVALFPGSRHGEVLQNLPLQLKAAELLLQDSPNHLFAVSTSNPKQKVAILEAIENSTLKLGQNLFLVPSNYTYELMRDSQTAIAKSGTVTLELALHQRPTVVIYSLSKLNHFIAKRIMGLNLPHYCIVNILAEKEVFPELIEHGLTSNNLYKKLLDLDTSSQLREACVAECREIARQLSITDASQQAARAVLELVK